MTASWLSSFRPWAAVRARRLGVVALIGLCASFGPILAVRMHTPSAEPDAFFETSAGHAAGGDFLAFFSAAQATAEGDPASAYDFASFSPRIDAATTAEEPPRLPWAYPPSVFALVAPLSLLAPWPAFLLWTAVMAGLALAACAYLVGRRAGAFAALAFPGVQLTLASGQISLLSLSALAVATRALSARPGLAGFALGLMTYKPHLAIGPLVLALMGRDRIRIAIGAAGGAGLLALLSLTVAGPGVWLDFLEALRTQAAYATGGQLPLQRMASVFAAVRTWGVSLEIAFAIHALSALLALSCCAALMYREGAAPWLRHFGFAASAIVVSPHVFDYDLAVFAIAFAPLLLEMGPKPEAWRAGQLGMALALALLPILALIVGKAWFITFAGPLLLGLLITLAWRERTALARGPLALAQNL